MTKNDQVVGILTKLAALKPEDFGLPPYRYRPNFILVGKAKPPEPKLRTLYCAGIGCGVSITFMSAAVALIPYLVRP